MDQNNFRISLTKCQIIVPGLGETVYSLVEFLDSDNPGETVMRMVYSIHTEVGESLSDSVVVKEGEEVEIVCDCPFWIGTL